MSEATEEYEELAITQGPNPRVVWVNEAGEITGDAFPEVPQEAAEEDDGATAASVS